MSRRLGNHRVRPVLSSWTHGKRRIEEIDRANARARAQGNTVEVARLEKEKVWATINSIPL